MSSSAPATAQAGPREQLRLRQRRFCHVFRSCHPCAQPPGPVVVRTRPAHSALGAAAVRPPPAQTRPAPGSRLARRARRGPARAASTGLAGRPRPRRLLSDRLWPGWRAGACPRVSSLAVLRVCRLHPEAWHHRPDCGARSLPAVSLVCAAAGIAADGGHCALQAAARARPPAGTGPSPSPAEPGGAWGAGRSTRLTRNPRVGCRGRPRAPGSGGVSATGVCRAPRVCVSGIFPRPWFAFPLSQRWLRAPEEFRLPSTHRLLHRQGPRLQASWSARFRLRPVPNGLSCALPKTLPAELLWHHCREQTRTVNSGPRLLSPSVCRPRLCHTWLP